MTESPTLTMQPRILPSPMDEGTFFARLPPLAFCLIEEGDCAQGIWRRKTFGGEGNTGGSTDRSAKLSGTQYKICAGSIANPNAEGSKIHFGKIASSESNKVADPA